MEELIPKLLSFAQPVDAKQGIEAQKKLKEFVETKCKSVSSRQVRQLFRMISDIPDGNPEVLSKKLHLLDNQKKRMAKNNNTSFNDFFDLLKSLAENVHTTEHLQSLKLVMEAIIAYLPK